MTATDFNFMVIRHENVLQPYAISLTSNYEDARDLYQETMLRALMNRDKYQFGTNLKAWLYTIMRNIFINEYRRNKKFSKVDNETAAEWILTNKNTVINEGWTQLKLREVRKAIDNLPDAFRLCFELYYTGYKYSEISTLLKEPLGTIKSRIHFARKTLTAQLER